MSPPPKTPTPRRFLLPKRPPASQTPLPQTSQFQSTPRFGSSSVPRPTQRRAQSIEDVDVDEDREESCPAAADEEGHGGGETSRARRRHVLDLDIDSDSDFDSDSITSASQHTDTWQEEDEGYARDEIHPGHGIAAAATRSSPVGRKAKRQRVLLSISPVASSAGSPVEDGEGEEGEGGTNTPTRTCTCTCTAEGNEEETTTADSKTRSAQQQPVFRPAPRFKLPEVEVDDSMMAGDDILPVAFSPRRRGQKYLAEGRAAQLQSWLSEVRGWDGEPRDAAARMTVEQVRPGSRMYLARGREQEGPRARGKGYLLAGEGRLTGLERRADVRVGSVVVLEEPVWEVDLMGESWTVVCNWSMVSS
ncbi:hypothetical protein C2857_002828 [Epichloe festucae Fl1]|uniref:Uncharacterized protein n=1 Tax=Epichloe festucae (strain Fl1) TaxID=877507 RepID=A0A7S9KUK6_EPIFF|nr:hypothetical protein C2857_002828 [Epichloe festucae Fl1]